MATYTSPEVNLRYPAETVFDRLSNLENLGSLLKNIPADRVPEDQRAMLESVQITSDTITLPGGPVGAITLRVTEKAAPSLIKLEGENTPVPLDLSMHVSPEGADSCKAYVEINIAIPAMLKPMVNGPLQKMADQFGAMLQAIPFS